MYLSEIPGYQRACERADRLEDYWRDLAFLGVTETLRIAGGNSLEARQLTLRMFIQLCAVRSPFLVGGAAGPEHVAQFLWRVSPQYDVENPKARSEFIQSIAALPFTSTSRAITRYLDRMLIDRPPTPSRQNDVKTDTSFAASIIHVLACNYGWSDEVILDLPMPRIFQYMRRIHRNNAPDVGFWNPIRDKLTSKITSKFLKKRK